MLSSFFSLALIEKKQHDLDYNKNWWSAYFKNPKNNSFNFFIENHSGNKNFHWEVFIEKNKIYESDVVLSKGENKEFPVSASELENKKITIRISNGNEVKEIYKILSNNNK